ncbi:hypothetical protein FRB95_012137 [Tulasnella sp. JGI-2019a]|nr:hypothetical protein FRB95_012137 [Tulasnella sp. JGI-2019a]
MLAMALQHPLLDSLITLTSRFWNAGENGWAQIIIPDAVSVPQIADTPDEVDEDEQPLVANETITFNVIDLVDIIFFPLQPSGGTRVLLRSEYPDLYERLKIKRSQSPGTGAVVTGQPGIGKTIFLFYLAIALIMDGEPFALQIGNRPLFIVRGPADVQLFNPESADAGVLNGIKWALSDSNAVLGPPPDIFLDPFPPSYVVQTTLPTQKRWKEWSKQRGAGLIFMKPFNWNEIYFVGTRIETHPVNPNTLMEMFTLYGSSAQLCFRLARNEQSRIDWERDIIPTLRNIPNLAGLVENVLQTTADEVSSQIPPPRSWPRRAA